MEEQIATDILGEEITTGCLVGFAAGTTMDIAIVSSISIKNRRLSFLVKKERKKYKKVLKDSDEFRNRKYRFGWKHVKGSDKVGSSNIQYKYKFARIVLLIEDYVGPSWIQIERGLTQNRILVIKNPMFHMDNKKVVSQIELVDIAKDQGLIPDGYVLGQPDTFIEKESK